MVARVLSALVMAAAAAAHAYAAQGDCAQPLSNGSSPTASDCLFVLRAAVGSQSCSPSCVCDTNGSATITASDSLLCLKVAVGQPLPLQCPTPCGATTTTAPPTSTTEPPTTTAPATSTTSPATTSTTAAPTTTVGASCGNGIIEDGETCDSDCPVCPAQTACFEDVGAAGTCDLQCHVPVLECRAAGDQCCPYAGGSGCSNANDADCAATQWKSMQWFQPMAWTADQCANVQVYGISAGGSYVFTTCHPDSSSGTNGDPAIVSVVDNHGTSYPVANDDCTLAQALPLLAGWSCSNASGAVETCAAQSSGGFRAGTGVFALTVTVCSANGQSGSGALYIWYQSTLTPNAG
ncbi:MAG TPA: hypothetical protein VEC57_20385 [Candidatus Limnocylindrales bacterium]|nr:hypothetical protein [Candidatus Limnocylindrales bacterium]